MRVVHVLWDGGIGGAERLNASLAAELRRIGVEATVLFVGTSQPLSTQLDQLRVPYVALDLPRGAAVLRRPHRFARIAREAGADAAILVYVGYLGLALRVGGYTGDIVGVEHGALLVRHHAVRRLLRFLDRAAAIPAYDAEVAISDFMAARIRRTAHIRPLVEIRHGIKTVASSGSIRDRGEILRVGHVSRLVPGKGADVAIRALAALLERRKDAPIRLDIAGEGPERIRLETLVRSLGLRGRVRFAGLIEDAASFWSDKDVAVALGDHFVESFGLAALEAMACGKPLIVSRLGALPELVDESVTGHIVKPGDAQAVASLLERYVDDPLLHVAHGQAALQRVAEHFGLERCARDYLGLLARL